METLPVSEMDSQEDVPDSPTYLGTPVRQINNNQAGGGSPMIPLSDRRQRLLAELAEIERQERLEEERRREAEKQRLAMLQKEEFVSICTKLVENSPQLAVGSTNVKELFSCFVKVFQDEVTCLKEEKTDLLKEVARLRGELSDVSSKEERRVLEREREVRRWCDRELDCLRTRLEEIGNENKFLREKMSGISDPGGDGGDSQGDIGNNQFGMMLGPASSPSSFNNNVPIRTTTSTTTSTVATVVVDDGGDSGITAPAPAAGEGDEQCPECYQRVFDLESHFRQKHPEVFGGTFDDMIVDEVKPVKPPPPPPPPVQVVESVELKIVPRGNLKPASMSIKLSKTDTCGTLRQMIASQLTPPAPNGGASLRLISGGAKLKDTDVISSLQKFGITSPTVMVMN